ncbi:MAG TPA: copper homeostasis protein CutC [Prolixibacteraceae bacterium]|nr:copper homeostasis protein CutC [Prolixibacteraceae bacterium]
MNPVKEVCVESFEEALKAVHAGAARIELCDNLAAGGTTPSYGTIKKCLEKLDVPIMVMIRPRGGNFIYSPDELEIMQEDIQICRKLGVAGVVFGLLDKQGNIDEEHTRKLVQLSKPLKVTFHKAIDTAVNILESVTLLKKIGVDRILSSGGELTALDGQETLNRMIKLASPEVTVIVAGKVTFENFEEIREKIPSGDYHGKRLVKF